MAYRLYGLTVRSDFALPARAVEDVTTPDLVIIDAGYREIPDQPMAGTELSHLDIKGIRYDSFATADGFVVRYPGFFEATIDSGLTTVEVVSASAELRPVTELLIAGNLFAQLLTLRGDCILHASAVEKDGHALTFVGAPGTGKSTMAAVLCAAGSRLVTDDVLRIVQEDARLRCAVGSTHIRLRRVASALAAPIGGEVTVSPDERTTVTTPTPAVDPVLDAIVFLQASRTTTVTDITRLSPTDTLLKLTMFPRVLGWTDRGIIEQTFRWNARLARQLPAFVATVPWGP
ncbi:MAG: hypothetical protein M3290_11630, partial [Actinomycetota bacterium]|nr:hypothetical protein [Actinomycetota bacterium]